MIIIRPHSIAKHMVVIDDDLEDEWGDFYICLSYFGLDIFNNYIIGVDDV